MNRNRPASIVFLALVGGLLPGAALAQDVLDLPIGDPARRDKQVALLLDGIVDTRDGAVLTPDELAARLADVDVLFVGESHTAIDFHRVQERVIRALLDAGRQVQVGLEMFPVTEQASLDRWIDERPSEEAFVRDARWYEFWGYHWNYYRDIFLLAQERGARMYALNAPREVVSAVRRKGIDGLDPEEAAYLPPSIDLDSDDHLTLFKSYFDEDDAMHAGMSDEQWRSMLAAQTTWDATMGWNAVRHRESADSDEAIMVVLIGSGHVAYGLGIERQARAYFDGSTASLIPVPVEAGGRPVRTVQASYADFIWGVPGESAPLYPSLGLSTSGASDGEEGLAVLFAQEGTPAADAGMRAGDRLLAIDGQPITDRESWNRLLAAKRWGDTVRLRYQRDGAIAETEIPLRRAR